MNIFKIIVLVFIGWSSVSMAADRSLGLGIILGSPTGISGQYMQGRENAIDGALAWDLGDGTVMHIHGDYLWRKRLNFSKTPEPFYFYYGIGGRLITWSDYEYHHHHHHESGVAIGPRFPAGLSYTFRDPVIELFGEIAAIMDIVPATSLDLDAGIGGRFYF